MTDLTTLADVKAWAKISNTTDDQLLQRLITAASTGIVNVLNRGDIFSRQYIERYDGNGSQRLMLRQWPVTALSALSIDGVSIAAQTSYPLGTGYLLTPWDGIGSGSPCFLDVFGYAFNKGRQNISVTYTAGYQTSAIPDDLAQACIELVALRYKERDRIGLASLAVGGETTSYIQKDVRAFVEARLQSYMNVVGLF